jgi:hypothetical protein
MVHRRYRHHSPLEITFATGDTQQDIFVDSYNEQVRLLRQKKCGCTA